MESSTTLFIVYWNLIYRSGGKALAHRATILDAQQHEQYMHTAVHACHIPYYNIEHCQTRKRYTADSTALVCMHSCVHVLLYACTVHVLLCACTVHVLLCACTAVCMYTWTGLSVDCNE